METGKNQPPEFEGQGSDPTSRFVEMLGAHERDIFRYIYALTGNWQDAQEIMQRVRIRLWQQFGEYDACKPFAAWARAIAYYLVLAFRKERSRQKEYLSERVMEVISDAFGEADQMLDDRREALLSCLERLRADQRKLVEQYYSRSEPVAVVAESMNMQSGTLRQALFRIRKTLHDCVERTFRLA